MARAILIKRMLSLWKTCPGNTEMREGQIKREQKRIDIALPDLPGGSLPLFIEAIGVNAAGSKVTPIGLTGKKVKSGRLNRIW